MNNPSQVEETLRKILKESEAVQLLFFCYDNWNDFKVIYEKGLKPFYDKGLEKEIFIDELVDHAIERNLLDKLVAWAKRYNPEACQKYKLHEQVVMDTKEILVVIVAMTRAEAQNLISQPNSYIDIQKLRDELRLEEKEFFSCYDEDKRENWYPWGGKKQVTIAKIISEATTHLKLKIKIARVKFKLITERFFADNSYFDTLHELKTKESIMIIDPLSLCHPDLREQVIQGQLFDETNKLAILVMSPMAYITPTIEEMFNEFYDKYFRLPFLWHKTSNKFYGFWANNEIDLQKWLHEVVLQLSNQNSTYDSSLIKQKIRRNSSKTKREIQTSWTGDKK